MCLIVVNNRCKGVNNCVNVSHTYIEIITSK